VIIKIERYGGLTGIRTCTEMDSKDLPDALVTKAKKIIENPNSFDIALKATPKGAADHYSFKISIQDGGNKSELVCNQYELQDDLKLLIKYIEKSSKRK
jgi:hypothetical protein